MASTYSTSLKLTLIGDGDQSGIWGQTTNTNFGTLVEQAITGVTSIVMADTNYTLTSFNGVTDEARNAVLVVTGTNTAQRDLIPPVVKKLYTVVNNTTGGYGIRVIGATGTGVTIPNGATCLVYCDGTNFVNGLSGTSGNFTVNGTLNATTVNATTVNATTGTFTTVSGNGVALTAINASNISSGTIANARTTAATANGASTIVLRDSNGSFAGNVVTGGSFSTANFTITESGGVLQFKYGGTTVMSMDSTGNLISATNITAYGTP